MLQASLGSARELSCLSFPPAWPGCPPLCVAINCQLLALSRFSNISRAVWWSLALAARGALKGLRRPADVKPTWQSSSTRSYPGGPRRRCPHYEGRSTGLSARKQRAESTDRAAWLCLAQLSTTGSPFASLQSMARRRQSRVHRPYMDVPARSGDRMGSLPHIARSTLRSIMPTASWLASLACVQELTGLLSCLLGLSAHVMGVDRPWLFATEHHSHEM
ncbi:hypothetical protein B0T16DRAFT_93882 [Cercophora newfieldiana]|uniref:Uncharacterized protein n=1 Tax=Cercophora newfieldiana TaxID=92897 RepID=A0AA39YHI8_9PEZI|nr:hypothetical protein B0T16DRAFT_93882 [Cercophora newfieldiana]